jgi:hypothetical protein
MLYLLMLSFLLAAIRHDQPVQPTVIERTKKGKEEAL